MTHHINLTTPMTQRMAGSIVRPSDIIRTHIYTVEEMELVAKMSAKAVARIAEEQKQVSRSR